LILVIALLSLLAVAGFARGQGAFAAPLAGGQVLATRAGAVTRVGRVRAVRLPSPPRAPRQLARGLAALDRNGDGIPDRPELPAVPEGPFVAGGDAAPPVSPLVPGLAEKGDVGALADTDAITFTTNTSLGAAAHNTATSVVMSPSTASNGNVVLYTGNRFAALSTDGGATFAYLNPAATFPDSDGGFFGNQTLQYVASIDRFIWVLQYAKNGSSQNRLRVAFASTADVAAGIWSYLDLGPQTFSLSNQWLDAPSLGLSNNYLYVTANVFGAADQFVQTLCMRLPLSEIAEGLVANTTYFTLTSTSSLHPAQNCAAQAYFAAHNSTSSLQVIQWDEEGGPSVHHVNVPTWSAGPYSSTTPGGFNWLGRVDSRVTTATVVGNEVWFGWTAAAGGAHGFPQPYANIVRVSTETFAFTGDDPLVRFVDGTAAAYPALCVNSNGEVAVSYAFGGGGTLVPNTSVGFLTGGDRRHYAITGGTDGPSAQAWGDDLAVRVDGQNPALFSATGYSLIGGSTDAFAVPAYVRFGRASDTPGAIQPDVYEADDSAAAAKVLTVDAPQFRNIHAVGNQDFATFTLATPANIVLATDGAQGDTSLALFGPDNAEALLETDEDDGNGSFSRITRAVTPGTYWVRVEESQGDATLSAYSLSLTAAIPTVEVTTPNGGETFVVNSAQTITWTSANVTGNVKLEFSTDGGSSWSTIVADTPNDGTHPWTVPNTPTTQARVRVSMLDASASDTSDANFAVVPPSITVTSPNGGETLIVGTGHLVTWSSVAVTGNVLLEYSIDGGGSWTTIVASTLNDGSEIWVVPNALTAQGRVRVSTLDRSISDASNASFSIQPPPPTITVTAPNGGETYVAGTVQTATWTTVSVIGDVRLQFSSDAGSSWTTLSETANDGSESWTVPVVGTTQGRVRIIAVNDSAADTSNANFTVVLPTITVTAPNGGESYPAGSAQTITWASTNLSGSVKLEYSSDGGTTWTVLSASTANDGTEAWTTPATPSSLGRIRVSAVNGTASDTSDASFAVTYVGGVLKTPARINFGTVKRLKPKTKKVVIQNSSKTANLIVSFATSGSPFSLVNGAGPFTIRPRKKLTVSVRYTPTAAGSHTGALTVTSSALANPSKAIPATGKAR